MTALAGEGFSLRRATAQDAEFLVDLATNEDIEPFMSASAAKDTDAIRAKIARDDGEPEAGGHFVIEVEWHASTWRAGTMAFSRVNERSRIAQLYGVMLHPDFRGRGIAAEATKAFARHLVFDLGFHRVQLECYGFNDRAIRHFERAGFTREGQKRQAYWRHDEWVDGVLFGLVREDLEG
ncbi:MAG TPA: GNAT family protein [Gaiellaceae bacterium]|jgi:RimJ/RimL family protein N-acetyltransferase